MARRWIVLAILVIFGVIAVRVVTRRDPPAQSLPRSDGSAYKLMITRFLEGEGLTCPPFRLEMAFDCQPDRPRNVIEAEQGDDIIVVQTPTTLYIFYSELVLYGFGGWVADSRDAQPLLCNVNRPLCALELQRLAQSGTTMQRICAAGSKKWQQP